MALPYIHAVFPITEELRNGRCSQTLRAQDIDANTPRMIPVIGAHLLTF